jgi:hypothetical protein
VPELPSAKEHAVNLKEVLKYSETVGFENGKKYLVFVDSNQVDFSSIRDICSRPAEPGEEFDIEFITVRKMPESSEEAVRAYEVMKNA